MKLFISFLFLISPIFTINIFACQCDSLPTVWSAFDRSAVVFVGKAVNSNFKNSSAFEEYEKSSDEEMIYEFEVVNSFKGVKNNTVKINLGEPNMCEFGFQIGETYLIYAYGKDEQNLRTGTFCSRNEKLIDAQDQLFFINGKLSKKPEPQFYGSIELRFKENEAWKTKFLPNYKFFIEIGKKKIEIITDENGNFKISNLKKGIYKTFVSDVSDYKPDLIMIQQFRVFESGRAIPYDEELPSGMNEREIEKLIDELPAFLTVLSNYSKGVYLEITLK